MIRLTQEVCGNIELALKREWLETNGIGGFASSTIAGVNTRRYHGLLTAATRPPVGRVVLLSKFEETLVVDGRRYDLSANRYPGAIHPQGHQYLKEFRLDPFPTFIYQVNGIEVEKRVFMVHGENTTAAEWELRALDRDPVPDCTLEVRPLIAFRDYHSTTHRNDGLDPRVEVSDGAASIRPYADLPALHFSHNAAAIETDGFWYFNFEYDVERERGLDSSEDLYSPFLARFELNRLANVAYVVSTDRRDIRHLAVLRQAELDRRQRVAASAPSGDPLVAALAVAADQFLVARGEGHTIVAGYHWFSDWGRDTMIALPGLTLVTGRVEAARGILLEFARHVDRGMLPNRFPDAGETPEYNTVDATLWLFEAVRSFLKYTGEYEFVEKNLYPALAGIVEWHVAGTRYGIRVGPDGLLRSGEPGVQLTWMDAKVGDWVVTPRHGKPVEIQALWYNALRVMEDLAGRFSDIAGQRWAAMAAVASENFTRQFWNDAAGCLYDVVDGEMRDGSIRPNQVLAASLTYSMLSPERARSMLEVVRRELLTPRGLRSLSPYDPRYRGRCEGDVFTRDGAYHQGTVWPWLLGPFITAWVRVNGRSEAARAQAAQWLGEIHDHLLETGLGQISEIFDGDSPHHARGCVAQAWSVAELLRAAVEDVIEIKTAPRRGRRRKGDSARLQAGATV